MTSVITTSAVDALMLAPARPLRVSTFASAPDLFSLVHKTLSMVTYGKEQPLSPSVSHTNQCNTLYFDAVMIVAGNNYHRNVTKLSGLSLTTGTRIMTIRHCKYELLMQFVLWITRVHPNFVVVARPEHLDDPFLAAFELYLVSHADFSAGVVPCDLLRPSDIFTVHSGFPREFVGIPEKIAVPVPVSDEYREIVGFKRWNRRKVMFLIRYRADPGALWSVFFCDDLFKHVTSFL
jgi:hypothetical protein